MESCGMLASMVSMYGLIVFNIWLELVLTLVLVNVLSFMVPQHAPELLDLPVRAQLQVVVDRDGGFQPGLRLGVLLYVLVLRVVQTLRHRRPDRAGLGVGDVRAVDDMLIQMIIKNKKIPEALSHPVSSVVSFFATSAARKIKDGQVIFAFYTRTKTNEKPNQWEKLCI